MQKDETRRLRRAALKPARGSARTAAQCWGSGLGPPFPPGERPRGLPPHGAGHPQRSLPPGIHHAGGRLRVATHGSMSRPTLPHPLRRARLCPA